MTDKLSSESYVGFEKNQDKIMRIICNKKTYFIKYKNMMKNYVNHGSKNQFQKWIKNKFKGNKEC